MRVSRSYPHALAALLAILFVLPMRPLFAQLTQDTSRKVQYLVVPIFFKTPETGWSYGASGSLSFKTSNRLDSLTRTSVIQAVGFLTSRQQNVQVIDASIYFPKEKYILLGQVAHSYFPDRFWGIGPETHDSVWEHYQYEQIYFNPHLKKKIAPRVFAGLLYEFQSVYKIRYAPGGVFDTSYFYGKTNYNVSGLGASLSYDTRNISYWPSKGIFFQTQATGFRKEIASDYDLLKWVTDLRFYKKIYRSHILAVQLYNYQTFGKTPLRELANFGGPNSMRGFYQGRFRASNMATIIAEYRLRLYKRFSGVVFGGAGNVYDHYQQLRACNIKYSYGAGIRFALLEREMLNIRVDYGYSDKFNRGLYVTVGECF